MRTTNTLLEFKIKHGSREKGRIKEISTSKIKNNTATKINWNEKGTLQVDP
jgi:hypothetical protein